MNGDRGLRAEEAREKLRGEVARVARIATSDHDVDQLVLADVAGVDPAVVSRQLSRKCSNTIAALDVRMWLADDETRPVALALLRWILDGSGLRLIGERGASSNAELLALLGESLDAAHGVQRAIVDATAPHGEDGCDVTAGELERIEAQAERLARVAEEVRLAARAEREARATSISGVRPAARA